MCGKEEKSDLELYVKWGCDASQQSQFKVKFENAADRSQSSLNLQKGCFLLECQIDGNIMLVLVTYRETLGQTHHEAHHAPEDKV
nr:unnamed protein product [Callosobruchus analis]